MKICLAQIQSQKGAIKRNIEHHLMVIQEAIRFQSDLIIFPELSITNYEPQLATNLATDLENSIFDPFEKISHENQITIGVGMPTLAPNGIQISLLLFHSNGERKIYSKQLLHEDELPYFVCGENQLGLDLKGKRIAFGICYESLQEQHLLACLDDKADIYIASVAKPQGGIEKAYAHFPKMALSHSIPILMANSLGKSDTFLAVGQSAIWGKDGHLLDQLNSEQEGILIFDSEQNSVEKKYLEL